MNAWLVVGRRLLGLIAAGAVGALVGGVAGELGGLLSQQVGLWLVGAEIGLIAGVALATLRWR